MVATPFIVSESQSPSTASFSISDADGPKRLFP